MGDDSNNKLENYIKEQLYMEEGNALDSVRYRRLRHLVGMLMFTDFSSKDQILQMVYQYGDMLEEDDYFGRIIFKRMLEVIEILQK